MKNKNKKTCILLNDFYFLHLYSHSAWVRTSEVEYPFMKIRFPFSYKHSYSWLTLFSSIDVTIQKNRFWTFRFLFEQKNVSFLFILFSLNMLSYNFIGLICLKPASFSLSEAVLFWGSSFQLSLFLSLLRGIWKH